MPRPPSSQRPALRLRGEQSVMSGRREPSPARLTAAKLSLAKLTGRQQPAGSICIRFNAASMTDGYESEDDDLTIGTAEPAKPSETVKIELTKSPSPTSSERSKSAPVSEVTTPVSPTGQLGRAPGILERVLARVESESTSPQDEEQRSLLAGFKERFQDKIQEPISQLIDKFSGENSLEDKEKKIRKSESLESNKSSDFSNSEKNKRDQVDHKNNHSRNASVDSNASGHEPSPSPTEDKKIKSRATSFEIVEDFYSEEPFEDFSGGVSSLGAKRSCSSDQISRSISPAKPISTFKRLMGSLDKGSPGRTVSMTLSGLLSSKENEEEELSDDDNVEFFDLDDQVPVTAVVDDVLPSKPTPVPEKAGGLPFQRMVAATIAIFAYLIIPLPSFLNGMVVGGTVVAGLIIFYQWLRAPPSPREPFVIPPLSSLPPLRVPEMRESKNDDGKFKGWMNELYQYNADEYHINQTHSVYVQLEGSILRLQRPKHNIPKRAIWDERPQPMPTFIHQRHFDLVGSKVSLLPLGLVRKRLWSKKYPLCLALAKTGSKVEQKTENELAKGMGYEVIPPEMCETSMLFLFARTGREKEAWFRRLDAATHGDPLPTRLADLPLVPPTAIEADQLAGDRDASTDPPKLQKRHSTPCLVQRSGNSTQAGSMKHRRQDSADSICPTYPDPPKEGVLPPPASPTEVLLAEYVQYMGSLMPAEKDKHEGRSRKSSHGSSPTSQQPTKRDKEKDKEATTPVPPSACDPGVLWLNAVIGRCLWDFLREEHWASRMREKIQRKLSKIHVPYMIDELTVTGIDMGAEVPLIRRTSKPYLDDMGMWVDLDVVYNGGFQMSLETKVNLMKLKKSASLSEEEQIPSEKRCHRKRCQKSPATDSEEEDSAESSTDEEGGSEEVAMETSEESGSKSTSRKLLRLVDKITQSKYFQQATEYKYIKRAMEEVSNTRLQLTVELRSVIGTLAVNIPPPPSDRLWYGFRTNPRLWLLARPKVGAREVTVTHITDWIEKKLHIEFQRVFVMPNMDDLPIPIMSDQLTPVEPESPS